MTKAEQIQFLTLNCSCLKGQDAALNGLSDEAVEGVTQYVEALTNAGELVQTVRSALGADDTVTNGELSGLVVNAFMKKKADCEDDKPATMNEWLAHMPDEAKAIWNSAVKAHDQEKAKVVTKLIANVADSKRVEAKKRLEKLDLPALNQKLEDLELFGAFAAKPTTNRQPDYSGAAGSTVTVTNDDDAPQGEPLDIPTINWAENSVMKPAHS